MALSFFKWSKTAASNTTADPSVNWQEGQAPSSVNDSARAMMASAAGYRDDISGAIITSGTSTAYTVSSNQIFDSLSNMNGALIAFSPHATSGATVTLNVDGLGAKPLRSAPSTELSAGTLVQGTPYTALYNHTDQVWYLHGFFGNPYNVPLGSGMDYWLPTAPNSSFVFPVGQAISRTTYATLFAAMGTTYGAGDGSTTFNLPDKRGRVTAALDNMGGSAASRLTNVIMVPNGNTAGAVGGSQSVQLLTSQLPAHTHVNTLNDPGHFHSIAGPNANSSTGGGGFGCAGPLTTVNTNANTTGITITNASVGSDAAHSNTQPTILCNYIMRII